jgi:hypothetical protein
MEVRNPNHKHPTPTATVARFLSRSLMQERSPRDLRYYLERIGLESAREEVATVERGEEKSMFGEREKWREKSE